MILHFTHTLFSPNQASQSHLNHSRCELILHCTFAVQQSWQIWTSWPSSPSISVIASLTLPRHSDLSPGIDRWWWACSWMGMQVQVRAGGAVASVGTGNSIKLNAGSSPPPPIDLLGRCHVYCKRDCSKCLKSILNVNGQLTHLHLGQFPLAQPMHCLVPKWSFHCSLQSAAFSRLLEWHVPRCFSFLPWFTRTPHCLIIV